MGFSGGMTEYSGDHARSISGIRGPRRTCQSLLPVAWRLLLVLVLLASSEQAGAYGILTHQQLIDQSWESTIVPILLSRFPSLTPEQLREAHGYAYGGSTIQDLGYYPFAKAAFSDLTHYVRSGDFVRSLFRHAHTADELAFAIGALSHYVGDSIGHSQATNPSVGIAFPKLSMKYGPSVNYAQGKSAHSQVEWAFDINQAAKRRVAPYNYVGYVGLNVPRDQLLESFSETYGFPVHALIKQYGNAMRAYRFGARKFLPGFTYAEVLIHHSHFLNDSPGPEFDTYVLRTAQLAREANWDSYRKKPGVGTHILAGLIVILPKIGPIKTLAIKHPTEQTEELYIKSVNLSTAALGLQLKQLGVPDPAGLTISNSTMAQAIRKENAEVTAGRGRAIVPAANSGVTMPAVLAPNLDLDTGQRVVPGGYSLTDKTYARLLAKVTEDPAQPVPASLKQDILNYYADPDAPISTRRDKKKWAVVQKQLQVLTGMPTKPDNE